ncbi:MAG TPA: histidine kinase, partial [Chitinophagaceae bacterium]|nr:histidine kinase [Chitinophagaceae bacterium]
YCLLGDALFSQGKYDECLESLKQGYKFAKNAGNQHWTDASLERMTNVYREWGEYENLLEAQKEIILAERKSGDTASFTIHELWVMGLIYMLLEEYPAALTHWRRLFLVDYRFGDVWNTLEYAQLLTYANLPDSALYYYNQIDTAKVNIRDRNLFLVSKGEFYLFQKDYATALSYLKKGLSQNRQLNNFLQTKRNLLGIGKAYSGLNRNDSAIRYAQEGLAMALRSNSKPHIRDAYQILYSAYNQLGQTDSAFYYYRNYITLKETVMTNQTRGKVSAYKYEQQIGLLHNEKQLHQQQLRQTARQKTLLIVGIAFIVLLGVFVIRYILLKRKNEANRRIIAENELLLQKFEYEKTKAELEQETTDLEMKALRAQMNPHFIFNSLNSINRFILQNNKAQASVYLTKFSKLVRMILQNSQAALITLESELESLELYLDLEALRFNYQFAYKISVPKDMDIEVLKVPPLIIQPYAENAIWHGLMHKEEKGLLDIEISQDGDNLFVKITDDGIGRKHAVALASKSATRHKSMGLKITADRIAMLDRLNGSHSPVTINDLVDANGNAAGTEVIIKMPVITN